MPTTTATSQVPPGQTGSTQESWLDMGPGPGQEPHGWWWGFAQRLRGGAHCTTCPDCTRSYDRWALLMAAVCKQLARTFRERGNVAALRGLDETLRLYGLSLDGYLGPVRNPLLQLHPAPRALGHLLEALAAGPRPHARRGRPEAVDQQWCDWRTAGAVAAWVHAGRRREAHLGWVGRAEQYADTWGQLLEALQILRGIQPPLLREAPPPPGALALWMDGHSEALRPRTRRLTAACLIRRIVTYLRYAPAERLPATAAAADAFVRRHEVAMKRRLDRTRSRMRGSQPRAWAAV